jgi:hypothetical protein
MKISVRVKPNAKQEKIEKVGEKDFIVSVKEKPFKGKANQAVIRVLAEYFDVSKSDVILLKGQTAKEKVFEVKKP